MPDYEKLGNHFWLLSNMKMYYRKTEHSVPVAWRKRWLIGTNHEFDKEKFKNKNGSGLTTGVARQKPLRVQRPWGWEDGGGGEW